MTSRFLFAGAILAAGMAGCTDIWRMADVSVSPDGEIRSPAAALEKVRALRSEGKIPAGRAAVVRFAPGTYFLEKELEVASADAPIDFIGAKGCRTVFSGGRRLEPFKAGADGIWRCKVPEGLVFEQLWVNGRRAQIARHPNKFYNYILASADEDVDPLTGKIANLRHRGFFTDPKGIACLAGLPQDELEQAVIHVWWAWDDEFQRPIHVDAAKGYVILRRPVGRDFFKWPKWCTRFTVENCRTALDAPGEWFLDRKKGEVLYVPLPGEKAEDSCAIAPALGRIAFVHDSKGTTFRDISFEHNGWTIGPGHFARQSAFNSTSALEVSNATDVAFVNCRIAHTANYGLWFNEGTHDSSVRHTLFEDLGAGGVRIGQRRWTEKSPPESLVSGIVVDDNIIHSGGHVFAAGTGVFITYARNCRVTHNEICDLYYSGICCGWCWGYAAAPNRDNELSWNHIHHLGKGVLSDMGFIYTLGDSRGTVVMGNHGHDMFSYGYTGSGGTGLYPDEGSRGILWTSNLVHHTKTSALSQHYGKENRFCNNIFAFSTKTNSSVAGRWRVEKHTSLICSNNVFVWSGKDGRTAWRGPGKGRPAPVHDLVFGSNLWWSPDPISTNAFNGGTWEKWRADGMDEGSVIADPLFMDWPNGDWRLKPESPALKIGFKPWDYTLAGVRKEDPSWRAKAEAVVPAPYEVAPVPPENPGRRSLSTGFEALRPGTYPDGLFNGKGSGRKFGYVMASTRDHRTGKQALEIRDFEGLVPRHFPHFYQHFKIISGTFRLKFSLKCDKKADLTCEWREWTKNAANGQYADGPFFRVSDGTLIVSARRRGADGRIVRVALKFDNYAPGKWHDLEFVLHTPKTGTPTWDFAITDEEGVRREEKGLLYLHRECALPDWIGFLSNADCETVSFIDDYSYENICEPRHENVP